MAISAVLVREAEGKQLPIYFISRVLTDAETRYPEMEKVVLALVFAARKLRAYFQTHTVLVVTSLPLKAVIHSPERAGRLMKWAVELGEHDIHFKSRTAIKS